MRLALAPRDQQMEQDRAPAVLLHQPELACHAAGQLPDYGEFDCTTTTCSALKVHRELNTNTYAKDIRVGDQKMAAIRLTPADFHGDWNYTISTNQDEAVII